MRAVTCRAKPHQFVKKSLDHVIGTQHSICETSLQYQYPNSPFFPIYALICRKFCQCIFYIIHKSNLLLRAYGRFGSYKEIRLRTLVRGKFSSTVISISLAFVIFCMCYSMVPPSSWIITIKQHFKILHGTEEHQRGLI